MIRITGEYKFGCYFKSFEQKIKYIMTGLPSGSSSFLCYVNFGYVYFPTSMEAMAIHAALAMVNITIALFGTLANGLVILAYYRNPRLRTIQNMIFLYLAITDLSVTAVVQPVFAAVTVSGLLGNQICLLWALDSVVSLLFVELSLVTITILSLQSYLTLAYPFRWQSFITKFRLNVAILLSWFLVLLKALTIFLQYYDFVIYGSPCIVGLTFITVILTWCWTHRLVSRHRKRIHTTQTPSCSQNVEQKKMLKSTVTAFAIIFSLLTCYSLHMCLFLFSSFLNPSRFGSNMYGILVALSVTLMYLNCLSNPCLVFLRSTCFRDTVKNMFIWK